MRAELGARRAGLEPRGAKGFEAGGLGVDVVHVNIDVHPVLGALRLRDLLEEKLRPAALLLRRHQPVVPRAADDVVLERRGPERGQRLGVVAVEHQPSPELGHRLGRLQAASPRFSR